MGNIWFTVGAQFANHIHLCLPAAGASSILWYFLDRANVAKVLRWFIILFMFNPLFMTLIVWAGVLDTWFDFRKIGQEDL